MASDSLATEIRLQVREARRHLHWLFLHQHWLQMWSEIDARFRKTVRSQETISAQPDHWEALIKSAELYQVNARLYEALKELPDDLVPDDSEVLGVWYVLVLSQCGASNEDLNRMRQRRSDGSLRAWSEIVQDKWNYQEHKIALQSGSL
jgi:hypothetical protein